MIIWESALAMVAEARNSGRYVELCADEHPDREYWRQRMIEIATGVDPVRQAAAATPGSAPTGSRAHTRCCGGDSIMAQAPD